MKNKVYLLFLLILCFSAQATELNGGTQKAASTSIYTWQENGQTIFSDSPPKKKHQVKQIEAPSRADPYLNSKPTTPKVSRGSTERVVPSSQSLPPLPPVTLPPLPTPR
jgi:hypothetical protein